MKTAYVCQLATQGCNFKEMGEKMKIIYYDGSVLHCSSIEIGEKELIADEIYVVPLIEVQRIVEDE